MFWWLAAAVIGYAYSKISEPSEAQRQLPKSAAGNRLVSVEREAAASTMPLMARREVTENEKKVLTRAQLDEEAKRMQNWVRSEFYRGNNAGQGKAALLNDLKSQPNPNVISYNRLPLVQPNITRLDVPPAAATESIKPQTPELSRITAAITSEEPVRISDDVRTFLAGGGRKGEK